MTLLAILNNGSVVGFASPADGETLEPGNGLTSAQIAAAVTVTPGINVGLGWTVNAGTFAPPGGVPAPSLAQQAQAMLAAGIQIVSTGTPALNGTYACDAATYQRIGGIVAAIGAGLGLPGGGSTFNWPDLSGAPHAFTAVGFKNFATAVMNFEYSLNAIIGSNSGTLPSQPVTIT